VIHSRGYEPGDLRRMLALVSELWPHGRHGIGYAFMAQRLPHDDWDARLWFDGETFVAWGWSTGWRTPRGLSYELRPGYEGLLGELIDWADPARTTVKRGDERSIETLQCHGFAHDPAAPWIRWNSRTLGAMGDPRVPDGYRLATMAEFGDFPSRSAAHRSAFAPSRFTDEVYAAVRREAPWRGELDCVVVDPMGPSPRTRSGGPTSGTASASSSRSAFATMNSGAGSGGLCAYTRCSSCACTEPTRRSSARVATISTPARQRSTNRSAFASCGAISSIRDNWNTCGRVALARAMEVRELWRYPVKSCAGERVESTRVAASGLAGDRVVQPTTDRGERVTARRFPRLLGLKGTLAEDGTALVDGHRWDRDEAGALVRAATLDSAFLEHSLRQARFDVLPVSLVTDGALDAFDVDHRRLRPNVVVSGVEGLAERA